jgi:hypothetical protein
MDERSGGGLHAALMRWTVYGSIAQLALAVIGHWVGAIRPYGYTLAVVIATTAGVWFAAVAHPSVVRSAVGGAIIGNVCAFVGVSLSMALGDTPDSLLVLLVSSTAGGAIGASIVTSSRAKEMR